MTAKQRDAIESAYAAKHIEITLLLADIEQTVGDLPVPVEDGCEDLNWGHVGTLGHVIELLKEAKAAFHSTEHAAV